MASVKERIEAIRERRPFVDHVVRMVEHFGNVNGSQQAGGVTYFGFLSFFPIMALAFFVIGYVAQVFPDAQDALVEAINGVLPDLVGNGEGQISLTQVQDAAGAVGLIGLAGVLYAGLGWVSALREGLTVLFERPQGLQPNFVVGKLRDLVTLGVLGVVLLLAVGLSQVVVRLSDVVLDFVGLDSELGWLVAILAVAIGFGANVLLFFLMFRILADPPTPRRALWSGALLGAVGFEVLKQLSGVLLASTRGQPAFQAFGIALVLIVWINYSSRVVMYAAAWAHTAPDARAARQDGPDRVQGPASPPAHWRDRLEADAVARAKSGTAWVAPFVAGSAAMLAAIRVVRRRGDG